MMGYLTRVHLYLLCAHWTRLGRYYMQAVFPKPLCLVHGSATWSAANGFMRESVRSNRLPTFARRASTSALWQNSFALDNWLPILKRYAMPVRVAAMRCSRRSLASLARRGTGRYPK